MSALKRDNPVQTNADSCDYRIVKPEYYYYYYYYKCTD